MYEIFKKLKENGSSEFLLLIAFAFLFMLSFQNLVSKLDLVFFCLIFVVIL